MREVEVAVQRLLEHGLVNLDGIDAGGLDALALALEVVAESRVVRVIAGRRKPIAEIARRPVAHAHADVHGLEEGERGGAVEIAREARGIGELIR